MLGLEFSQTAAITLLSAVLPPAPTCIACDWPPGFLSLPEALKLSSLIFLKYLAENIYRKRNGVTYASMAARKHGVSHTPKGQI